MYLPLWQLLNDHLRKQHIKVMTFFFSVIVVILKEKKMKQHMQRLQIDNLEEKKMCALMVSMYSAFFKIQNLKKIEERIYAYLSSRIRAAHRSLAR